MQVLINTQPLQDQQPLGKEGGGVIKTGKIRKVGRSRGYRAGNELFLEAHCACLHVLWSNQQNKGQ